MGGKPVERRYIATYDVIDDSVATRVCTCGNLNNQVKSIEIDGVLQSTKSQSYQLSLGEHIVKIELKTSQNNNDQLFANCSRLTSIVIPEGTTSLSYRFAASCANLASITIPKTLTTINATGVFQQSGSQKDIYAPDVYTISNIDYGGSFEYLFNSKGRLFIEGSEVHSISLTVVKGGVFYNGCLSLESVTIEEGVTTIGSSAFRGCSNITNFTFPSSLETIGAQAFNGCSSVESFAFPNGLETIGDSAFVSCGKVTIIDLPSSVESIGNSCFQSCGKLASLIVRATTPPTCGTSILYGALNTGKIYVPAESVEDYKAASGWSSYSSRIQAIPSTSAYIQNGLIVMYDGIENAGAGQHSDSATIWKDLVGSNDLTLYGGNYTPNWNNDSYEFNGMQRFEMDASNVASMITTEFYSHITTAGCLIHNGNTNCIDYGSSLISYTLNNNSTKSPKHTFGLKSTYCMDYQNKVLYQNNVQQELGTYSRMTSYEGNTKYLLGCRSFSGATDRRSNVKGQLYCLRIYSRVLTAEEIAYNYNIDRIRFGSL